MSEARTPYWRSRVFAEAEVRLVGSILRFPDQIDDIAGRVVPEHFLESHLGEMFAAVLAVRERCDRPEAVNYDAVALETIRRGKLGESVVYDLLARCLDQTPGGREAEEQAATVAEGASVRRLYTTGMKLVGLADAPPGTVEEAWAEAERDVLDREADERGDGVITHQQAQDLWAEDLDERTRPQSRATAIPTGLRELDDTIAGLSPGQLVIVGARTGNGKTLLALHLTRAAATEGCPVLFFTYEMSVVDLTGRMNCAVANVDGQRVRHRRLTADDTGRLVRARSETAGWPIEWVSRPDYRIDRLVSVARRAVRRRGVRLVVVDYLQLIPTATSNHRKRYEEVGEMSRALKLLATELRVPVIALSQLNRESDNRPDRRPRISDLRESGNLEQDADTVMLLHRPEKSPRPGEEFEVIVAKQRAGPSGVTCRASLDTTTGRITDWAGF